MPFLRLIASTLPLLCAAGCATFDAGKTETVLKLQRAWVDGHLVEYVTTDISDAKLAQANGVNYVPRLADAIPADGRKSLVERVYKFPQGEQLSVFPSAPRPAGGSNADAGYSPLWRLVFVTWLKPDQVRPLQSEEAILAAQDKGDVALKVSGIVANCPIVKAADGSRLAGGR